MMLLIVLVCVASATAGRLENTYLPPNTALSAGGGSNILSTPFYNQLPSTRLAAPITASYAAPLTGRLGNTYLPPSSSPYLGPATTPVPILRLNNDNNGDGSYRYEYETANHIAAQESGRLVSQESSEVQGSYSYLAPNGQTITVNYIADENGFRPAGDHLPTPPPVPEAILRSLEINAAEEARGIVDDGQYRSGPGVVNTQYLPPLVRSSPAVVNTQYLPPVARQGGYRY